jgi:hypothetical protein
MFKKVIKKYGKQWNSGIKGHSGNSFFAPLKNSGPYAYASALNKLVHGPRPKIWDIGTTKGE